MTLKEIEEVIGILSDKMALESRGSCEFCKYYDTPECSIDCNTGIALAVKDETSGVALEEIKKIIDVLSDEGIFNDRSVHDFCEYKGICRHQGDSECINGIALAVEEKLEESNEIQR